MQSLIQNSLRSELKVRLNTAINTIDARAIDVKYHKNCFKEELRTQQHLIDPKGEKMKDENKGSNIEKIVEIEIINAVENEIRNGAILSMNDIKMTFDDILDSYCVAHLNDERKFSKRSLKEIISKNISHAIFTPQSNPNLQHLFHSNEVETERQSTYKTQKDCTSFRIPLKNVYKSVIRFTRNACPINNLHNKGMSISNLRALQIETA